MRDRLRQATSEGLTRLQDVWARADPYVGVVAFVGGFAWDALTLVRVDRLVDNAYLAACLVALGALLVLERRVQADPERWPRLAPHADKVTYAAQFLFGSLFSAYVVFYFKSSSDWQHLVFLGLLAGLLVANEFLHAHLRAERLRVALYWLVSFSFVLFVVPVITGWAGTGLFVVAAAVALALTTLVVLGMYLGTREDTRLLLMSHAATVSVLFLTLAVLDTLGVVPPIPLALVDHGVFHDVRWTDAPATADGARPRVVTLSWLDRGPWSRWAGHDDTFVWREGDRVHFFSAVFAPTGMTVRVLHEWQRWDEASQAWVTTDDIDVSTQAGVRGGADQGFRTWSAKRHVTPGSWRVRVHLANGRMLGGQRFTVVADPAPEAPRTLRTRTAG